jgi:hypothetical protein
MKLHDGDAHRAAEPFDCVGPAQVGDEDRVSAVRQPVDDPGGRLLGQVGRVDGQPQREADLVDAAFDEQFRFRLVEDPGDLYQSGFEHGDLYRIVVIAH